MLPPLNILAQYGFSHLWLSLKEIFLVWRCRLDTKWQFLLCLWPERSKKDRGTNRQGFLEVDLAWSYKG